MAQADIGDIVRVVNEGDQPFTIGWDSKQYKLEPGKDAFVPFEAACLWFGDPRSGNAVASLRNQHGLVSFVPDRDTEVRRLRVKYGNIGGDERFVDPAPSVSVYDLEGDRITTVLDDPEGANVTVASPSVAEQSDLVALVQKQQRQIDLLLSQMGLEKDTGENTQGLDDHGDAIEEEGPEEGGGDTELDADGLPVDATANS